MYRIIKRIVQAHGHLDTFTNLESGTTFHLHVDNDPYQSLVIERIRSDIVSLAHYAMQNGDPCQDPEMTFRTPPRHQIWEAEWIPLTYTQAFVGVYQEAYPIISGVERVRPQIARSLIHFARGWARNIREQRYHGPETTARSLTHPAKSNHP